LRSKLREALETPEVLPSNSADTNGMANLEGTQPFPNFGIKEGKADNCYFGELYYFGWGD
jgi:hypothetical protein